ncbi:hypothetical protein YPPY56_0688, partial [Yersinia pestis PY-56]
MGDCRVSKG